MLRIGICEDERWMAEQLHSVLVRILFPYTDVEILSFTDGAEVMEAIDKEMFCVELLFLDIHMKHIDGMRTAEFIREKQIDVDIIFLTFSKEHVFEGYKYKAFAYHLKPLNEERLAEDLKRYMEEKRRQEECLKICKKGKELYLTLDRILYFKSENRRIIAYTKTDETVFYGKLDDVELLVKNKGFMRCHQSYMVNSNKIDVIKRKEIIVGGISVPMSRKYYESMEQQEKSTGIGITHSLAMNREQAGAIVFVKGKLLGAIIRIKSDREIRIGRDGSKADIVVNDMVVSRLHVSVTYHSETGDYTIYDYSKNGIYRPKGKEGNLRLPKRMPIRLNMGDEICLGDARNVIRLG